MGLHEPVAVEGRVEERVEEEERRAMEGRAAEGRLDRPPVVASERGPGVGPVGGGSVEEAAAEATSGPLSPMLSLRSANAAPRQRTTTKRIEVSQMAMAASRIIEADVTMSAWASLPTYRTKHTRSPPGVPFFRINVRFVFAPGRRCPLRDLERRSAPSSIRRGFRGQILYKSPTRFGAEAGSFAAAGRGRGGEAKG